MSEAPTNTLVIGHPRSGTTWISEVLAAGRALISEPDNEVSHPLAYGYKTSHRFPDPSDYASSGLPEIFRRASLGDPDDIRRRALQRVLLTQRWRIEPWVAAKCGAPDATSTDVVRRPALDPARLGAPLSAACRRVMPPLSDNHDGRVIKTVHGIRCADQIQRTTSSQVVVVLRNPFAVLASMRRPLVMAGRRSAVVNPDRWRNIESAPQHGENRDIHQLLFLMTQLVGSLAPQDDWILVSHDEVCRHPELEFERVAAALGFPAGPVLDALRATIGEGEGLSVRRRSPTDQIDGWKRHLDDETVDTLRLMIQDYELGSFLETVQATGER